MNRRIIKANRFDTGYGTHKYKIEYEGDWSDIDLITATYNRKYENPKQDDLIVNHLGGWVRRQRDNKSAIVHVYYD